MKAVRIAVASILDVYTSWKGTNGPSVKENISCQRCA